MRRIIKFPLVLIAVALVTGACSQNSGQDNSALASQQPAVKITPAPSASENQNEYEIPVKVQNGYATVREAGFSFTFKAANYGRAALTKEKKFVTSEPSPIGSFPEYCCFHLEDKRPLPAFEKGPRYFFPARSSICIIPLSDSSEKEF